MFDPVVQDTKYYNSEFPPSMIPIKFKSGNNNLLGIYFTAQGSDPKPTVLLLHGFPGNEVNFDFAHSIRRNKWNVLVFHYSGSWGSEGTYSWSDSINDTQSAINYLKNCDQKIFRIDKSKIVLVGHSLGGFNAFYNSLQFDEIKNVAWLAGFNFGYFANFIKDVEEFRKITLDTMRPSASIVNGTTAEELLNEMTLNSEKWNLLNYIDKLKSKKLLMIGAEYDSVAPNEIHFDPLLKALEDTAAVDLTHDKLTTGHSFSSRRIELQRILITWLNKIVW